MQRSRKFFDKLKYRAIMSPLISICQNWWIWKHDNQVLEDACDKYDYGVAYLRCVMMLIRSWLCLDTWFLRMRFGVRWTQPAHFQDAAEFFLTHVAHLLKLQDIHIQLKHIA